jgi:hypothetical protein
MRFRDLGACAGSYVFRDAWARSKWTVDDTIPVLLRSRLEPPFRGTAEVVYTSMLACDTAGLKVRPRRRKRSK